MEGDSRGYWEDDTLVVVTKNFSELTASFSNFGTAKDKMLTERFTRVGPNTIDYEWTLDDPSTFTDKITAIVPIAKVDGQIYEYACHEGNYGMVNMLAGERARGSDGIMWLLGLMIDMPEEVTHPQLSGARFEQ